MKLTKWLSRLSDPKCLKDEAEYEIILPVFDRTVSVPKFLFQICLLEDGTTSADVMKILPESMIQSIRKLMKSNPDWEYRLISNYEAESFIFENYGNVILDYFHRIDPHYGAARADLLRYLLIYRYGGAYLDIKSGLTKELNRTVNNCSSFPLFFWDNMTDGNHHAAIPSNIPGGEILQTFILSPAGHPYLRSVILEVMKRIDRYNPYVDGIGYGGVMKVTGPGMYSEVVYKNYLNNPMEGYIAKPFADFGFVFYALNAIPSKPGEYQKQIKMSNYRTQVRPVVRCKYQIIGCFNCVYLWLMSKRRQLC